jgi:hypothetical protein
MGGTTKLLECAIERIRELPAQDQDALANALLSIAGDEARIVQLDDETRAAVEEGLAQANPANSSPAPLWRKPINAGAYEGSRTDK